MGQGFGFDGLSDYIFTQPVGTSQGVGKSWTSPVWGFWARVMTWAQNSGDGLTWPEPIEGLGR